MKSEMEMRVQQSLMLDIVKGLGDIGSGE